jgi:hypothetical protein
MAMVFAVAVACWVLKQWGPSFWSLLRFRTQQTSRHMPTSPAGEVIAIPCVIVGGLLGGLAFWLVNRLGAARGFLMFAAFLCVSLLFWVVALNLPVDSLWETEAGHLSLGQLAYAALLIAGTVLPIGAFLGWRFAELDAPNG